MARNSDPYVIYLIGSLRNLQVPVVRQTLEDVLPNVEVFASWFAAGEIADDRWQAYEKGRGLSYVEALQDYAAQHVLAFDKHHLNRCDAGVLVYPAGKSGHTELGYILGQGKPGYVLLDEEPQDRWDVMLGLADGVFTEFNPLVYALIGELEAR